MSCNVCQGPTEGPYCDAVCERLDMAFPGLAVAVGDERWWDKDQLMAAGWRLPSAPQARRKGKAYKPKGSK